MALFSPPETLNEPHLNFNTRTTRMNTLAYTQAAQFRDPRLQSRKSTPNWLVVVVPAPSLTQEPQLHAHTLATSPPGRFTDGIIIPLFPSLYAQLAAIAREYNMPSTVGLCIYLQTIHAGALTTPRISDETWPLLWNHLSDGGDPASRSLSGPPIAGRIEFDIDQRKGRWLETWLGLSRKASVDLNPSFRASWHLRDESKLADKVPFEYATPEPEPEPEHEVPGEDYVSVSRKASPPRTRGHLRRLSLLRGSDSSPSSAKPAVNNLPTIISPSPQIEGPVANPNQELTERVQSWREGSLIVPLELPEKQASSDGNLHAPLSTTAVEQIASPQDEEVSLELNLDDFAWSISSLGPGTEILSPLQIPSPTVSVHLVGRLVGSVCLTPTTATSFGPNDDAFDYDAFTASRLPSPDIAYRVIDDVPCTPTTATSWGAPSWAGSEVDEDVETQSVDIAYRCAGSIPTTPVEVTSNIFLDAWKRTPWGLMWPFGVEGQEQHVGEQSLWAHNPSRGTAESQEGASHWPHNAARGALTGTRPSRPISIKMDGQASPLPQYNAYIGYLQYSKFLNSGLDSSREVVSSSADAWKLSPWGHIWPYKKQHLTEESLWPLNASRGTVATSSVSQWPYNPARGNLHRPSEPQSKKASTTSLPTSAVAAIRSHAYHGYLQHSPFLEMSSALLLDESFSSQDAWKLNPWGHIWPYTVSQMAEEPISAFTCGESEGTVEEYAMATLIGSTAPARNEKTDTQTMDNLFSAHHDTWKVTPWGYIWPYHAQQLQQAEYSLDVRHQVEYPDFNLYPATYPSLEIYPPRVNKMTQCVSIRPYSNQQSQSQTEYNLGVQLQVEFPNFNLYPAAYPFLEIYPTSLKQPSDEGEYNLGVEHTVEYPDFNLYPAAYPFLEIYPASLKQSSGAQKKTKLVTTSFSRMSFEAPAPVTSSYVFDRWANFDVIYPNFTIYPAAIQECTDVIGYPSFSLYPAIYPNFDLYPSVSAEEFETLHPNRQAARPNTLAIKSPLSLAQGYPHLVIYPSAYPEFDLYPSLAGVLAQHKPGTSRQVTHLIELQVGYPVFALYPPVYPHIEPYPSVFKDLLTTPTSDYDLRGHTHIYSNIEPYPAPRKVQNPMCRRHSVLRRRVFVHDTVSTPSGSYLSTEPQLRTRTQVAYDLRGHQHIYPKVEPYRIGLKRRRRQTHTELHNVVFRTGYRATPSGLQIVRVSFEGTDSKSQTQLEWSLSLSPMPYPQIEPYPGTVPGSTTQERIKRLALALNEQGITPKPTVRRILSRDSPTMRSFASGLYSPLQPPPISPPLC